MKKEIVMPTNGVYGFIPTHKKPHIEEIAAIELLTLYGAEKFPGIENAQIVFWDAGYKTPNNLPSYENWDELIKLGYVPAIGCGGSMFDEHANPKRERIEDECSVTLVAKFLGLDEKLWMQKVLKYCKTNDLKGASHPYDPGNMIKLINDEWFDKDPQYAVRLARQFVKVMINDQIRFFNVAGEAYEACSEVHDAVHRGKNITIVSMVTDDVNMPKYARSSFGDSADVVIKKDSKGHVYISTTKASNIVLTEVVKLLRVEEFRMKNPGKPVLFEKEELEREAVVEGIEEWHYEPTHAAIYNGSKTATEKPATKLSLEQIIKIVETGLNERKFSNRYYSGCLNGTCVGDRCAFYEAHLTRCYEQVA